MAECVNYIPGVVCLYFQIDMLACQLCCGKVSVDPQGYF